MKSIIYLVFVALFMVFELQSQDTFSIIAVDTETGAIGAAGASCVDGIADFGGIQLLNQIIPGKGGVNAQAWVCINPHINLENAMLQMENNLSPEEIISWLQENDACSAASFNPNYRQYGIVDLDSLGNARVAAFTGENTDDYKGHIVGENYAIQGNILLGPEVLEGMETGFLNTEGSLAAKLMGAMQGANFAGADVRCLDRGTSSTSAFLRVVNPEDSFENPYLELNVLEANYAEEPIDSLQVLFDEWLISTNNSNLTQNKIQVFPNPCSNFLHLIFSSNNNIIDKIEVYGINGQLHIAEFINNSEKTLDVQKLKKGIYLVSIYNKNEIIETVKFIKI